LKPFQEKEPENVHILKQSHVKDPESVRSEVQKPKNTHTFKVVAK
jgi:hypothetical protein